MDGKAVRKGQSPVAGGKASKKSESDSNTAENRRSRHVSKQEHARNAKIIRVCIWVIISFAIFLYRNVKVTKPYTALGSPKQEQTLFSPFSTASTTSDQQKHKVNKDDGKHSFTNLTVSVEPGEHLMIIDIPADYGDLDINIPTEGANKLIARAGRQQVAVVHGFETSVVRIVKRPGYLAVDYGYGLGQSFYGFKKLDVGDEVEERARKVNEEINKSWRVSLMDDEQMVMCEMSGRRG